MKRLDLIRKLEEEGCLLSGTAADTTGIKTLTQGLPNQFHAIVKSKNFSVKAQPMRTYLWRFRLHADWWQKDSAKNCAPRSLPEWPFLVCLYRQLGRTDGLNWKQGFLNAGIKLDLPPAVERAYIAEAQAKGVPRLMG